MQINRRETSTSRRTSVPFTRWRTFCRPYIPYLKSTTLKIEKLENRLTCDSALATIAGTVFVDYGSKGLSPNDPGMQNVRITLFRDGGNKRFDGDAIDDTKVNEVLTDLAGHYAFENIEAGNYFILQSSVNGINQTADERVQKVSITSSDASGSVSTIIDRFIDGAQELSAAGPNKTAISSVAASSTLGKERDILIRTSPANTGTLVVRAGQPSQGNAMLDGDPTSSGEIRIAYDGLDGNAFDLKPSGLGNFDLTDQGTAKAFRIDIAKHIGNKKITIRVYSSESDYSDFLLEIPQVFVTEFDLERIVPFSSFTKTGGIGANFQKVNAIELRYSFDPPDEVTRIRLFDTVKDNVITKDFALPQALADLGIRSSILNGRTSVEQGSTFFNQLNVYNSGPTPSAAEVKIVLPSNLTVINLPPNVTLNLGNVLTWSIPLLNPSESTNITIPIHVDLNAKIGSLTTTSIVSTAKSGVNVDFIPIDPVTTNNVTSSQLSVISGSSNSIPTATGTISGIKFLDQNGNGIRDSKLVLGDDPIVVFVVDVSGSTDYGFEGSLVGDLNFDGADSTILDAELAAFIALQNQLIDRRLGSRAQVAVVAFDSTARIVDVDPTDKVISFATPLTDLDRDGTLDIEQSLRSLESEDLTNFQDALRKTIDLLSRQDLIKNKPNVIFLSDGFPTGFEAGQSDNDFGDEVSELRNLNVNLRAFGVGSGSSLEALRIIDPKAVQFLSTDDLLDTFNGLNSDNNEFTEPTLGGWTIYLDENDNGELDLDERFEITDGNGTFLFANLALGNYVVREQQQPGFRQTSIPTAFRLSLTSTSLTQKINFGNQKTPTLETATPPISFQSPPEIGLPIPPRYQIPFEYPGLTPIPGLNGRNSPMSEISGIPTETISSSLNQSMSSETSPWYDSPSSTNHVPLPNEYPEVIEMVIVNSLNPELSPVDLIAFFSDVLPSEGDEELIKPLPAHFEAPADIGPNAFLNAQDDLERPSPSWLHSVAYTISSLAIIGAGLWVMFSHKAPKKSSLPVIASRAVSQNKT